MFIVYGRLAVEVRVVWRSLYPCGEEAGYSTRWRLLFVDAHYGVSSLPVTVTFSSATTVNRIGKEVNSAPKLRYLPGGICTSFYPVPFFIPILFLSPIPVLIYLLMYFIFRLFFSHLTSYVFAYLIPSPSFSPSLVIFSLLLKF